MPKRLLSALASGYDADTEVHAFLTVRGRLLNAEWTLLYDSMQLDPLLCGLFSVHSGVVCVIFDIGFGAPRRSVCALSADSATFGPLISSHYALPALKVLALPDLILIAPPPSSRILD
ncbi:hypothetical protein B0H14DRAFT_3478975 [Mycena olivaceomarginata]|nr:hypothetical protein B0H14DRAFT_3478975 [Mycena olivaceomarginata]